METSLNSKDAFIIIHVPGLRRDTKIGNVSCNLLPNHAQESLKKINIRNVDLLVFSGDISKEDENEDVNRLISELSRVTTCNSVISIPGELDLTKRNLDSLLIKGIRNKDVDKLSAEDIQKISQLHKNVSSTVTSYPPNSKISDFYPRFHISHFPKSSSIVGVLTIDTTFFSIGNDTDDYRSLTIGGGIHLEFLQENLESPYNIIVGHHHPNWSNPSQTEIIRMLRENSILWLYGHFDVNKNHHEIDLGESYLLGAQTDSVEYQIIVIDLLYKNISIYISAWDKFALKWKSIDSFTRSFQVNQGKPYSRNSQNRKIMDEPLFHQSSNVSGDSETNVDAVILTTLPEEFHAICDLVSDFKPAFATRTSPNIYAWQIGNINCEGYDGSYSIAVGMIGRSGTTKSALATIDAIEKWHPRYVFYVGIAGGFGELAKGDVVIADVIHGYEYGKIEENFHLRHNLTFRTDQGLLNGIVAFSKKDIWKQNITSKPPRSTSPKVVVGEVASGDKVVDDPTNEFFSSILEKIPRVIAVEMEGAGAEDAIELAHSKGYSIGFMMIRGISDLPRKIGIENVLNEERVANERENWKVYASESAAALTIGWIQDGLPIPPKK